MAQSSLLKKALAEENAEAASLINKLARGDGASNSLVRTSAAYLKLIPQDVKGLYLQDRTSTQQYQAFYPSGGRLPPPDSHSSTWGGVRDNIPQHVSLARVVRWLWERHQKLGHDVEPWRLELLSEEQALDAIRGANEIRARAHAAADA